MAFEYDRQQRKDALKKRVESAEKKALLEKAREEREVRWQRAWRTLRSVRREERENWSGEQGDGQ